MLNDRTRERNSKTVTGLLCIYMLYMLKLSKGVENGGVHMRWGQQAWLKRLLQPPPGAGMRRRRRWKSSGKSRFQGISLSFGSNRRKVKWHSQSNGAPSSTARPKGGLSAFRKFGNWKTVTPKPKRKRRVWMITLLVFVLLSIQMFLYVDKHIRPPLMHLAKIRVKQMATQAINRAITEQITNSRPLDQLIEWKTDNQGKVSSFILNSNEHMRITSETVSIVQHALLEVEEFSDHIPLGQALGSTLIASFGPRIPVKMEPQGAVKVDLSTRAREVAINMVLVEVYIKVVEEVAIVIPFDAEPEVLETEIPISYLMVVGDVPMYYYDGNGNPVGANKEQAPSITLPPLSSDKEKEGSSEDQTVSKSLDPSSSESKLTVPASKEDTGVDSEGHGE